MIMRAYWVVAAALLLSACATTGSSPKEGSQQAVSAQTAGSDMERRAKLRTELGSLYLEDGRVAVALEEARAALAAEPTYAPAYSLLGLTHMALGETRLAEENFLKALALAPGDPEINNNYGWFLCQDRREKRAMEYFMAAARNPLYATPGKPYANAGVCAVRMKDDKLAEEYLTRAIRWQPNNPQALYWMADLQYRQGRYLEARQHTLDIEKIMEPTAEAIWLALRIERKLGGREMEARLASQLRRRFPGSPEHRQLTQGNYE